MFAKGWEKWGLLLDSYFLGPVAASLKNLVLDLSILFPLALAVQQQG